MIIIMLVAWNTRGVHSMDAMGWGDWLPSLRDELEAERETANYIRSQHQDDINEPVKVLASSLS